MNGRRVSLCLLAVFSLVASLSFGQSGTRATSVIDIRGRTVSVPLPASRLLIDDGRYLIALSLIHPDPSSALSAWPHDINRIGEPTYAQYKAKFPRLDTLPTIASSAGSFALEPVLAIKPDVAVFSLNQGPSDEQIRQLAAAGIPVVFIDFFTHPFENLEPSLKLLGQLTGREAQAEAFNAFRRAHLQKIQAELAARKPPVPVVFFEAHAGISAECCNAPGKGNIGDYITMVGGHNIGADVLPGATGRLNAEYIVSRNPEVYIATGGPHLERQGGLVLGPGYTMERARASLVKMTQRPGLALLPAVKSGRVYGLAHQLLNSPLDILAVESLARWIHPTVFADLNPSATLAEINARFLAVPLEGTNWIDVK